MANEITAVRELPVVGKAFFGKKYVVAVGNRICDVENGNACRFGGYSVKKLSPVAEGVKPAHYTGLASLVDASGAEVYGFLVEDGTITEVVG